MKRILHRIAYVLGVSLICFLTFQNVKAANVSPVRMGLPDSTVLKPMDTLHVAPDITIVFKVDDAKRSFHFSITKGNSATLNSADISADFTIAKGFTAAFDARRVALLVADQLKAGNTPSLTKAELTAKKILIL